MNKQKLLQNTISLKNFSDAVTTAERGVIDSEKKYYELVVSLKEKRESLGLTQEKLAQLSNVPRTTITKVESGSRNATLETLMKIAEALGTSVELRLI
ncbi:helix-turn-helix transcriptional regulator [Candidatus Woesebacteria bacterium]|nr:helix-turn-helix transcriptional regulator [Candidatus Woesebacteria bacterium]